MVYSAASASGRQAAKSRAGSNLTVNREKRPKMKWRCRSDPAPGKPFPPFRVRSLPMRHALLFSVFVVASCGLAYELIAGALSSYLLGDSILQFSTIIGSYLFAMGIGAHLSRYVRDEDAIARFVDIELAIGLFGGFSAAILFLT